MPYEETAVLMLLQFKIDQAGLISGTVGSGTWAAGQMIANNNRIHELLQMQADHNARLTAHCNIFSAQVNAHAANAMVSPRRVFASGVRC